MQLLAPQPRPMTLLTCAPSGMPALTGTPCLNQASGGWGLHVLGGGLRQRQGCFHAAGVNDVCFSGIYAQCQEHNMPC